MLDRCSLSQVIVKLCRQHDPVARVYQRQLILVFTMVRLHYEVINRLVSQADSPHMFHLIVPAAVAVLQSTDCIFLVQDSDDVASLYVTNLQNTTTVGVTRHSVRMQPIL